MRILGPNMVALEKDEVIPVFCECRHIYQPPRGSEISTCEKCGRINDHRELEVGLEKALLAENIPPLN